MNRRGFFVFLAAVPVGLPIAIVAASAAPVVLGIDGGALAPTWTALQADEFQAWHRALELGLVDRATAAVGLRS